MGTKTALRILRRKQVEERVGLSRSAIYDRISPKSPRFDPAFPRPCRIGNGRAVGWLESELNDWIAAQVKQGRAETTAA